MPSVLRHRSDKAAHCAKLTLLDTTNYHLGCKIMAAKSSKNKARKKKRTAKHVLDAQKKKADGEYAEGTAGAADDTVEGKAPTKAGKKRKEKDPSEAEAYLSAWKHRDSGQGVWKFNKNTQSWLIRNVYEGARLFLSSIYSLRNAYSPESIRPYRL